MPFTFYSALFLCATLILYYVVRRRIRPYVLLGASFVYIWYLSPSACLALLAAIICVYCLSLAIASESGKRAAKLLTGAGILLAAAALVLFKYGARIGSAVPVLSVTPAGQTLRRLILPLGFSYYIFQAISYLMDLYRGKVQLVRNPFLLALYFAYFPKFISGPIERPEQLLTQLRQLPDFRFITEKQLSLALSGMLYGYFLKVVVADRLSPVTALIFESPEDFHPLFLVVNIFAYSMQLYCDFAGYSAAAAGISQLFGIELTQNFRAPYFALSITEFWKRWHISLSSWLMDYIYIPLGGSRRGIRVKRRNLFLVFLVSGFWHGNGVKYIAWGMLHGLYLIAETFRSHPGKKPAVTGSRYSGARRFSLGSNLARLRVFCLTSAGWFLFGISSLRAGVRYSLDLLHGWGNAAALHEGFVLLGVDVSDLVLILLVVLTVFLMDLLSYVHGCTFGEALLQWKCVPRYLVLYGLIAAIIVFGIYGGTGDAGKFIYMDF